MRQQGFSSGSPCFGNLLPRRQSFFTCTSERDTHRSSKSPRSRLAAASLSRWRRAAALLPSSFATNSNGGGGSRQQHGSSSNNTGSLTSSRTKQHTFYVLCEAGMPNSNQDKTFCKKKKARLDYNDCAHLPWAKTLATLPTTTSN